MNESKTTLHKQGDCVCHGDYIYTLKENGWSVKRNSKVANMFQTSYGEILEEIDGIPITDMTETFEYCDSLKTAPKIPSGVTNMQGTFNGCRSLRTAPTIPNNVTNIESIFEECDSLAGEIEINARDLYNYEDCFLYINEPIILTGTSPHLHDISSEYSNVKIHEGELDIPNDNQTQPYPEIDEEER